MGLLPGDVIRLRIWREPDLSGDFVIEPEGGVMLPQIGPVTVVGRSPASLRTELVETYRKSLTHSSIQVSFLRRVQVLGAVRNPGLYPLDGTMTFSDALALAGGTTSDGDPSKLQLIRRGERLPVTLTTRMQVSESPIHSGDQIFVPERRWLSRNPGVVAAGLSAVLTIGVTILTRR